MKQSDAIHYALRALLRPVVRFCLRHSLQLPDVLEAAKSVFLEVAKKEMESTQLPVNVSRLSVMTGIQRREVMRLLRRKDEIPPYPNLISRVIGQWRHDSRFSTNPGKPRVLEAEGKQSEFSDLVRSVSKDLNPYTVLFELERMDYIERVRGGLKLRASLYIPQGDVKQSFTLLSDDCADLISAVEENVFANPAIANLHLKTQFDNIYEDAIPEIREWVLREGSLFHEKIRKFLSQFDKDLNQAVSERTGKARIAVGAFSVVEQGYMIDDKERRI